MDLQTLYYAATIMFALVAVVYYAVKLYNWVDINVSVGPPESE